MSGPEPEKLVDVLREPVRAVSYGGGVQSTALLVLAAEGRIDFDLFIFANTGDDSEHPDTLAYMEQIARPYAAEHGIELVTVEKRPTRGARAGQVDSLAAYVVNPDVRSIPIPVRLGATGAPGHRSCTRDWKIKPVERELRRRGATPDNPATVALGISVDEIERAKPGIDKRNPLQDRVYPLLDLGIHRSDCRKIIEEGGLPVPPKSACFFCPYHDLEAWRKLKRETPDLFDQAADLETKMAAKALTLSGIPVYLTGTGRPLREVVDDQQTLDGMDGCDSGWCMT